MLKLAVIGKDVSRSHSPAIHLFLLGKMGVPACYKRISLPPEAFADEIEGIFSHYDAFNVTIPYKAQILPYLSQIHGDAEVFGAVNTVVSYGRQGFNTDGLGFLLMLENAGVEIEGKTALVLGVGGAGRSCIKKLYYAGAKVSGYDTDADRLAAAHGQLGCFTALGAIPQADFDLVVNCTGIGMHATEGKTPRLLFSDGEREADAAFLSRCATAVDLIYEPKESAFLRIARKIGRPTVSGGAMLFYQAYFADCIFIDRTPSAEEAKALYLEFTEEQA